MLQFNVVVILYSFVPFFFCYVEAGRERGIVAVLVNNSRSADFS